MINERANMIEWAVTNSSQTAKQALILLYQNQTPVERKVGISLENNFVGFDAIDDEFLSHCADVLLCELDLDVKQTARLKRTLSKYVNQLVRIESGGVHFPINQDVQDSYKPSTNTQAATVKPSKGLAGLAGR